MAEQFDDVGDAIDAVMDAKDLHRTEGRRGLESLCTLCRILGYKDPQYFGTISSKASVGDLVLMLEDNSGAIESIIEWMKSQRSPEWLESLNAALEE